MVYFISYGLLLGGGMGFGGIFASQCAVNQWFDRYEPQALTITVLSGALSGVVLPILCQRVVSVSWRLGWTMIVVGSAISLLLTLFVVKNKPSDIGQYPDGIEPEAGEEKVEAIAEAEIPQQAVLVAEAPFYKNKAFYICLANYAARCAIYFAFLGHVTLFMLGKGFSAEESALSVSVMSFASLFGRLIAGFWSIKKFSTAANCFVANILAALSAFTLVTGGAVWAMYLSALYMGFGNGLGYISSPMYVSSRFSKDTYARVLSFISIMVFVAGAVGPTAAGFVATLAGTYVPVFIVLGILALCGSAAMLIPAPERKK